MGGLTTERCINDIVYNNKPDYEPFIKLYKQLHLNPELSHNERTTAETLATFLPTLCPDLKLHTNIGGHGVVAVIENGKGPKVLLRSEMDALPVKEDSGLDYASTKTMVDTTLPSDHPDAKKEKPVMHACGHDMHMTALLASAETLVSCRHQWSGTLILLFQPAEEKGDGARIMLADNVYEKIGHTPDVLLAGHVMPYRAGYIGTRRGLMASSADSLEITLFGRGGHSSLPQSCIDPVLLAAHTVVRLQSVVSREVGPAEQAVITVASIHAGDAENVIPDTATIKVDIRAIDPAIRSKVVAAVRRVVLAEALASNCVREPEFQILRNFPILENDEAVTEALEDTFRSYFGTENGLFRKYAPGAPRVAGSEDFGELASAIGKPACYWVYGATDQEKWDELLKTGQLSEKSVAPNHSAKFAPAIMPTLEVGTESNVVAALTWLLKR